MIEARGRFVSPNGYGRQLNLDFIILGRLIRTETDTGVCSILDSRAREGAAYHDRMLVALPPCRVTSSVEAVRQFMADRKPLTYFK